MRLGRLAPVALLTLLAPNAAADILTPGQILRVTFTIDNNWTTVPPDVLSLNFGIITVNAAYTTRSAALYDGSTLLGTDVKSSFGGHVGLLSLNPSNSFASSTSVWTFKGPEIVDFTSILDGTIDGVIDFTIQTGEVDIPLNQVNLSMIRGTGSSSGTVVNPQPTVTSVSIVGDVGTNYCTSTANSTGSPAIIAASGSASVAANDLVLQASPVPAGQNGIFFYGPQQTQIPFGNGFRCVSGGMTGVARLPVEQADTFEVLEHAVDLTSPPTPATTITAGSTWNFQAWYRDPAAGGAFFNLSDGLEITFVP